MMALAGQYANQAAQNTGFIDYTSRKAKKGIGQDPTVYLRTNLAGTHYWVMSQRKMRLRFTRLRMWPGSICVLRRVGKHRSLIIILRIPYCKKCAKHWAISKAFFLGKWVLFGRITNLPLLGEHYDMFYETY